MINTCHFCGNLTRDPELRQVPTSKGPVSVVNFDLAVNNRRRSKGDGERMDVAYVTCEAWDTGAEVIARHVKKGDPLYVEAMARTEQWTDKEGQKRSKLRFRVKEFRFMPRGGNRENGEAVAVASENEVPF